MTAFRKAKAEQAALKIGMYGLAGSGKTFTALLCAEGLAKITKKRIAFIDTERGTDFYAQKVESRKTHPDAFDFDAIYTRSLMEILNAIREIKPEEHSVLVIDSMTHVWEAARAAYSGKETKIGTIPFHAWAKIKKPYKELISYLLSSPLHVFILGRQGNEFEEDEETGETKKVGVKMKAEGETAYEPHILIRMESMRSKSGAGIVTAFAEKDRTGILANKVIQWPDYESLIKPLLPLLGSVQAQYDDGEAAAVKDADEIARRDIERINTSAETVRVMTAEITLSSTKEELEKIGKKITPELKKQMLASDVELLRESYLKRQHELTDRVV